MGAVRAPGDLGDCTRHDLFRRSLTMALQLSNGLPIVIGVEPWQSDAEGHCTERRGCDERDPTVTTPELFLWADVALAEWRMLRSACVSDQRPGTAPPPQSVPVRGRVGVLTSGAAV
jgi:hypothetical protein